MTHPTRITAHCRISQGVVYQNGEAIFKNQETDLAGFLLSVYRHLGLSYPKFYKMDRLSKLGWLASEVLLKAAGFQPGTYPAETLGVVLTNASASLDTDLAYLESAKTQPSPALFVYTLPNIVVGEICIRNGFKGENAFFIFDQFDAGFLHGYVSQLLENGLLRACLCGWVELLEEGTEAVLFFVEEKQTGAEPRFTVENLTKIYQYG